MLSVSNRNPLFAAAIAVGFCLFSIIGCGSDTASKEPAGGSTTASAKTEEAAAVTADASAKQTSAPDEAAADAGAMPRNDLAFAAPAGGQKAGLESEADAAPEGIWTSNYQQALAQAKKEGKDVLLNFTGSDWCAYCVELHDKVFRFKEFSDYATKNFVLVELDFPRNPSLVTPETMEQNMELQNKLEVEGFPAIFLTDADGRPYARTGFQPVGPEGYVTHLTELAEIHKKRDTAMAEADKLSGVDKAKKLDEALAAISPELWFTSYQDVVDEILQLDADNAGGLNKKYHDQLMAAKLRKSLREIQELLQTSNDIDGALKKIDDMEAEFGDFAPARNIALQFRIQLLEIAGRHDEIIELTDKALTDKTLEGKAKLPLYGAKLNALASTEKYADAVEVADVMRKEFGDDKNFSTRILVARAELLSRLKRNDEAQAALQEAREMGVVELQAFINQAEKEIFAAQKAAAESADGPELDSPAAPTEEPADTSSTEAEPAETN